MAFKPGQSGNPSGRPTGIPNAITSKLRETLGSFLEEKIKDLPIIFDQLQPDQKIDALVKIAAFVIPKLSSMIQEPGMTIERFVGLPDEERRDYLNNLIAPSKNGNN